MWFDKYSDLPSAGGGIIISSCCSIILSRSIQRLIHVSPLPPTLSPRFNIVRATKHQMKFTESVCCSLPPHRLITRHKVTDIHTNFVFVWVNLLNSFICYCFWYCRFKSAYFPICKLLLQHVPHFFSLTCCLRCCSNAAFVSNKHTITLQANTKPVFSQNIGTNV